MILHCNNYFWSYYYQEWLTYMKQEGNTTAIDRGDYHSVLILTTDNKGSAEHYHYLIHLHIRGYCQEDWTTHIQHPDWLIFVQVATTLTTQKKLSSFRVASITICVTVFLFYSPYVEHKYQSSQYFDYQVVLKPYLRQPLIHNQVQYQVHNNPWTKIIKTPVHTDHMFIPIPLHISPICDEGE